MVNEYVVVVTALSVPEIVQLMNQLKVNLLGKLYDTKV